MFDALQIRSRLRDYSVEFVTSFAAPLASHVNDGAFVVCDANVFQRYRKDIEGSVPPERLLLVEAHESNKTLDKCQEIIELLVGKRIRRNHTLVAIGGGITEDITAFTASIIYRGIDWVFFPTTLLAQADSCIGSKTSINLGKAKNLVGGFYPPAAVYIDARFLDSLTVDDVRSGIGEIMHFYLYSDSPMLRRLITDYGTLIEDRSLLSEYIRESLAIKQRVIQIDEFDRGERQKFNYGHTFGHALESATDYEVSHGQAVTVGMDLANYLSVCGGLLTSQRFDELHALLTVNFPYFAWKELDLDQYMDLLSADKKNTGDDLTCILSAGPGRLLKARFPMDTGFKDLVRRYFADPLGVTPEEESGELLPTVVADPQAPV